MKNRKRAKRLPRGVVADFKVYARHKWDDKRKRGPYFIVTVFTDKETMYRYHVLLCKKMGAPHGDLSFAAITCAWKAVRVSKDRAERLLPNRGNILFTKDRTGGGIMAHEMTHAALALAVYDELDPFATHAAEEEFCRWVGNLCNQFACEMWGRR